MRLATTVWGAVAAALAAPTLAVAADCAAPYTSDQLLGDLVTMEEHLRNEATGPAGTGAQAFEKNIACLNEVLPPIIIGRVYRSIAGGLFAANPERATAWFHTALEVDGNFSYGVEDLSANNPVRLAYERERSVSLEDPAAATDKVLSAGKHFIDGRKLSSPAVTPNRPHLYQRDVDGKVQTWMIEGNALPGEVLVAQVAEVDPEDGGKKPKEPKNKKPKGKPVDAGGGGIVEVIRDRPGEKTPLMIIGSVVVAGGAGLYVWAMQTEKEFNVTTDSRDRLNQLRKTTNALVVSSALVTAAGAGTLTWGIILGDRGIPGPALHIRF